jgi:hypothetical protein
VLKKSGFPLSMRHLPNRQHVEINNSTRGGFL